jgi:hypothetical protein
MESDVMSGTQQDILTLPVMVMLPVARWNQILETLGERPWREVNPLIVDIHRQVQDGVQAHVQLHAHHAQPQPHAQPPQPSQYAPQSHE